MRTHFYASKTNRPKSEYIAHGKVCKFDGVDNKNFSCLVAVGMVRVLFFLFVRIYLSISHESNVLSVVTSVRHTLSWCEFIII